MTINEVIERVKDFLTADIEGVHVTTNVYEKALERKLPFIVIDLDEAEINNSGSKIPYGIKIKFSVMCIVKAKGASISTYRSEAESLAREVVASFTKHINELAITAQGFAIQEMLIGSLEVSGVNIPCEVWIKYE